MSTSLLTRMPSAAVAVAMLLLLCSWGGLSLAAETPDEEMSPRGGNATEITATSVRYSHQTTTVVFTGDVQVVRSDFQLWCNRLTVHLRRQAARSLDSDDRQDGGSMGQDLSQQFEKIVAEGEVRITMGDREATGQRAVYEAASNTLTLQGNVILQEGQNRIQGQKVTFSIDENTTEIAGGEQEQVKALFFPSEDGESDNGLPSGTGSE